MARLSEKLVVRYVMYSRIATCFVILGGLLVLVGWLMNNQQLMNLFPDLGEKALNMHAGRIDSSVGLTLVMLGSSLILLTVTGKNRIAQIAGIAIALIASAGSGFAAYCMKFSEEVVEPFIKIPGPDPAAMGITWPLDMPAEVGLTLCLVGLAIATLPLSKPKALTVSQILVLASIVIPLLIILGVSTRVKQLCALGGCFDLSVGFSVLAIILCSAIFLSRPNVGLAAVFSEASTGSALLRRATLFICLVPPLLMARAMLESPPLHVQSPFDWILFVFAMIVLLGGLIASSVRVFNRVETDLVDKIADMKDELERTSTQSKGTPVGQVEMSGAIQYPKGIKYKRVCLTCTSEYDDQTERCPLDSSPLSRVIDESLVGTIFQEKYEVIDRLGSGGMSTVYKARHLYFEKFVAIKVLKGNTAETSEGLKRFQREARATSAVSHPGIVGVSDFGLTPDGRAFLVMDYLEGESLSHFLDRVGRLQTDQAIDLASQLCDALKVAHESGIVHRDLKPSNIMLVKGEDDRILAKIVDFGLAKIIDEDQQASMKITKTGDCFGSPLYMAPEQCMGKKVDHRCDIYALGCILFECLVGNPPIIGVNAADTITKHVKERPAAFPEGLKVPKEIKLIIYKALHKEPTWRPQSVMEIKDALAGSLRQL